MDVLLGTTNPSKARRFSELLNGCGITFYTLQDLKITAEPEESGSTPEENAVIKAAFYGRYCDSVICNDSGLYFDSLPPDDPRQPGLQVRTPGGRPRMDDDEMLAYYSGLVHSLGGQVTAYYLDGIAVWNQGRVRSFMEDSEATRASALYMVDTPSGQRRPGWPLDSISRNRDTLTFFTDSGKHRYDATVENIFTGAYRQRLVAFLKDALGCR